MCPPKPYVYTSEDYFRSITTGNHKVPPSPKIFFRELRKPKTKRAWVNPYPLKPQRMLNELPLYKYNKVSNI